MVKEKTDPNSLPRAYTRALLGALSRKNFSAALDLVKSSSSFEWERVYFTSASSSTPSLINTLFPDTELDTSLIRLSRSILRECLNKGYDPSLDKGVVQDFVIESDRKNFKAFCDVIKDYPKDHEKIVWSILDTSTAWWTDRFEYLLTPNLKNTERKNTPFLLDVWSAHAVEYPLSLPVAKEVCLSMKNCLTMGYVTEGETPLGDIKELMRRSIGLAYAEDRQKVKECIDDILAFMSKKDLQDNLETMPSGNARPRKM